MLYPSMMFRLNGIDPEKAGDAWRTIPQLMEKAEAKGTHKFPRKAAIVRPQRSRIEWRVNFTQLKRSDGSAINGLEPGDLTQGEIDGRRQAVDAFHFLRTVPGFENSYIVDLPPQLGIRETRRVVGGYQLSGEDVLGCASFDDSIGVNGWPMEEHVAGDVGVPLSADPGVARLQRIALSHAGARKNRQSAGRRALCVDDP